MRSKNRAPSGAGETAPMNPFTIARVERVGQGHGFRYDERIADEPFHDKTVKIPNSTLALAESLAAELGLPPTYVIQALARIGLYAVFEQKGGSAWVHSFYDSHKSRQSNGL